MKRGGMFLSAPTRKLVHPKFVAPKPKMVQCLNCSGLFDQNIGHTCRGKR